MKNGHSIASLPSRTGNRIVRLSDPRYTDEEIDYEIDAAPVVYHGTTISRARSMDHVIEPRTGDFLREVYPRAKMQPLVFAADRQCKGKIWSSIRFSVAQELGIERWDVTIRQFVENAALLEIATDRPKFRQASAHHRPQRGVEKFDFFSAETVKADRVIVGRELVEFFGEGFLQANLIYDDWDVDGPAIGKAESAMKMIDGEYKVSQALLREFPDLKLKASGLGRIDISNPDVMSVDGIALIPWLSEQHGVLVALDSKSLTPALRECAIQSGFGNAIISLQYEPAASIERNRLRVEQEAREPDYLHGHCHILALALQKVSGRPLAGAIQFDTDIDQWALVHAWVKWDDDKVLDANGLQDPRDVVAEYIDPSEVEFVDFTRPELLRMGEGKRYRKADVEAKIEAAMPLARQLVEAAENRLSVSAAP